MSMSASMHAFDFFSIASCHLCIAGMVVVVGPQWMPRAICVHLEWHLCIAGMVVVVGPQWMPGSNY